MSAEPQSPPWHRNLATWRRIRRHAVPRPMIERAAERREAGDWRGACAAANVDVRFDLDAVAREHGTQAAARLADDLRHLAPDLLRWNLPRVGCGRTTIVPQLVIALARYGDDGFPHRDGLHDDSGGLGLYVVTPMFVNGSQRLKLILRPGPRETTDWTGERHLFDVRHSGGLLAHCGGGPDRAPFFHADGTLRTAAELPASPPAPEDASAHAEWALLLHERGDLAEAFDAVGIDLSLERRPGHPAWFDEPSSMFAAMALSPPMIARAVAERAAGPAAGPDGAVTLCIEGGWARTVVLEAGGARARPLARSGHRWGGDEDAAPLAEHHWRRPPDLELLRAEMITPEELHPLVRSALFPARPAAEGPVGPPGTWRPEPVRVRCRGEWHEVRSGGGGLEMPHSLDEQRRERALEALGGAVSGCFAVHRVWRTGKGRLPRGLREQRREVFLRVQHGDTEGVLALLDAGLDPFVRDGRKRTLMHQLYTMDHTVMLPRLLDAGLGLEDLDHHGRTPLHIAVGDHGSAALVRALVDAGAHTDVSDDNGTDVKQMIELRGREDLDWL
ncbi:ankyrin repeat domain-containing protein [Actinomadura rubrisoli]|uniref:Ankyrin repeat domain-containing protein n=1 Tax=Actinomadura rubrisoli TaxID=2530368 RepID=A0A4R5C6S6_9ACTN|nr:ankyrin repeat domain-containing protein [Actinomadura rubrisoli]TDD94775.1 ankyrin repeat domain-containing protein [Actinomadura rubrisoli]